MNLVLSYIPCIETYLYLPLYVITDFISQLTDVQITIQSICVIKGPGFQSFHEMTGNFRQYAKWLVVTGITQMP